MKEPEDSGAIVNDILAFRESLQKLADSGTPTAIVAREECERALELAKHVWGEDGRLYEFWASRLDQSTPELTIIELRQLLQDLVRSRIKDSSQRSRARIDPGATMKLRTLMRSPRKKES